MVPSPGLNLLTEGIPITKEFLDYCYNNNYYISLKTGDYSNDKPAKSKSRNNATLVTYITKLYLEGNCYPGKYCRVFDLSKEAFTAAIKRALGSRYIPGTELYPEQIQEQFCNSMLKNHGVMYAQQSTQIREKTKQTNLANFGVDCNFKSKENQEKTKQTNLVKYGVANPMQSNSILEKRNQTNLARYGGCSPLCDEIIKEKSDQTNLVRYGTTNAMKNEQVQQRVRDTMLERYGTEYAIQDPTIRQTIVTKSRQTNLAKYGVEYAQQTKKVQDKISKSIIASRIANDERYRQLQQLKNDESNKTNAVDWITSNYCSSSANSHLKDLGLKSGRVSKPELIMREFLDLQGIKFLTNKRPAFMQGLELDIWIPEKNVAIEINGIYWHSSLFKSRYYHQNKKKIALANNVSLMMFTDLQILDPIKFEIIKSIITHRLGLTKNKIHARKCKIKTIDSKTAEEFLSVTHLDGYVPAKINYGLYYNNELVQICTFSRSRYSNEGYELIRSATKLGTVVQGGFQKLIKHFKSNYQQEILASFINANYYDGSSYSKISTIQEEFTSPDLWFVYDGIYSRQKFMKHNLHKIFPEFPKRGDPEYNRINTSKFLQQKGVVEYYGCGNLKCFL